jgi:WD40 repeat protein
MTPSESQSVSSPNSIEQLISKLGEQFDLTGEQIADVLWLTLELQKFEVIPPEEKLEFPKSKEGRSTENSNQTIDPPKPNEPITSTVSSQKDEPHTKPSNKTKGSVYSASGLGESQGLKIGIPDAPSLRAPLTLAHEFRPLMRRVATGKKLILDEAATVQRIAEERICIPVLQAEPEHWLDLALVIDESHSMSIWGHTIRELKEMFKKYGIFRDIRVWGLQPDETGNKLQLFSRMGSNKRLTEPKEIIDPTGRRLVLIVSDCVSNIWRKGMMFPILKAWTQKQPLAILQMLPEWMWRRTALDLGTAVGFKSSIMGVANQELSLHKPLRRSRSIGFKVEERSKIPVITLDPEKAAQWSQMLVGKADALVPGYLLPPELEIEEEIEYPFLQREQNTSDAAERVQNFRMTTSPLGRELAGLLAASPVINLPVVRLIQESLLPKSNQVQVAEVFLGGLLRPKSTSLEKLETQADLNPDLVEYEFIEPEIRDLFMDDASVSDSIDVINAVSRYVAEQLGVSLSEFMAILKVPQKIEEQQREGRIKPFAEITARVLRKLGGEYVKFAEELEKADPEELTVIKSTTPAEKTISNKSLSGHSDSVRAIAFSPDGKYLVSGSNDRTVRLWDLQTGQVIKLLEGHQQRVKCVRVSDDGKLIISGSADSTVKIWNIETGECIRTIKTSDNPNTVLNAISINSNQNLIATGSSSGTVKLWNWNTAQIIYSVAAAYSSICCLAIDPDANILVSGSAGKTIKIWHLNNELKQPHHVIPHAHMSEVLSLEIHDRTLISGGKDRTIKIWDLTSTDTQPNKILHGHDGSIRGIAISPDGTKFASASGDRTVKIWNLKTREILETLTEHLEEVKTVAFSPDGKILVSGGSDNTIKIWRDFSQELFEKTTLLWQQDNTKVYSLFTESPWSLPFDALVIPVSQRIGLNGRLAQSFREFIGKDRFNLLYEEIRNKYPASITPKLPLLLELPPQISQFLQGSEQFKKQFLILATVENPYPEVENAAIAIEAILEQVKQHNIKTIYISLLGTGKNKLSINDIGKITLSKIQQYLLELSSDFDKNTSDKQIILFNNDTNSIATINQIATEIFNLDYQQLQRLLLEKKWQEADRETNNLILKAANRKEQGYLDANSITQLSCEYLQIINRLWTKYSSNRFGFSVQNQIYREVGETDNFDRITWAKFAELVGWNRDGKWLDRVYSLDAPSGHLPFLQSRQTPEDDVVFFSRITACDLDKDTFKTSTFKLTKKLFLDTNNRALQAIENFIIDNGWIELTSEKSDADYIVTIGEMEEFIICDRITCNRTETPYHNLHPLLSIHDNNAPQRLVKRLVHLAKYHAALEIENTTESTLNNEIEYELLDVNRQPFSEPNNIILKSGDRLYVRLKNVSSQPLNVAVLDFEATWEISQIPIQGDRGAFYSLQPGEETFTRLRFQVPNGEYYQQAREILKLFVTRGIANFQWLILPPLDEQLSNRGGNLNEELQQIAERRGATRGEKPQISPLNQLLSQVGADVDKPPTLTRAFYDPDPNAEWLTRSIVITVE